jgi:hypothetical protein
MAIRLRVISSHTKFMSTKTALSELLSIGLRMIDPFPTHFSMQIVVLFC